MNSWPSERVAHGGLFHLPKVTYSKETHALLKRKSIRNSSHSYSNAQYDSILFWPKVLMEEQKMSILQRSRIENYLKNGAPLPKPTPLRTNTTKCRPNVDFLRARTAKRRTLAAIKASGALEYDKWVFVRFIQWHFGLRHCSIQVSSETNMSWVMWATKNSTTGENEWHRGHRRIRLWSRVARKSKRTKWNGWNRYDWRM